MITELDNEYAKIPLLKTLLRMTQDDLLVWLPKYLREREYKVFSNEHYIIAAGEIPVCLVAHLDTVGPVPPQKIYYDEEEEVLWSPNLQLGADDRAGVFSIIQIIEHGFKPHILFTTDEELGCVGASVCTSHYPNHPFKELKMIIELDRQGFNDCVFYSCNNKEFKKYIKTFGFKEQKGSFSDISVLGPEWGVAAVNLSISYYEEHTPGEYLIYKDLDTIINKVELILKDSFNINKFYYTEKHTKTICPCCRRMFYTGYFDKEKDKHIYDYCPRCNKYKFDF